MQDMLIPRVLQNLCFKTGAFVIDQFITATSNSYGLTALFCYIQSFKMLICTITLTCITTQSYHERYMLRCMFHNYFDQCHLILFSHDVTFDDLIVYTCKHGFCTCNLQMFHSSNILVGISDVD